VLTFDITQNREQHFFVPTPSKESIPYNKKNMTLTGVLPGFNTPLSASEAGAFEKSFLQRHHLDPDSMKVYKDKKVF
jgi:tRNA(Glu) U13 pseudouridine synthase TruD